MGLIPGEHGFVEKTRDYEASIGNGKVRRSRLHILLSARHGCIVLLYVWLRKLAKYIKTPNHWSQSSSQSLVKHFKLYSWTINLDYLCHSEASRMNHLLEHGLAFRIQKARDFFG